MGGCKKKIAAPDNPPTITSFQPTETGLIKHIGDVLEFLLTANDPDDDVVSYRFLKDGDEIVSNSEYSWIVNKKGIITILGIAYNDLADTTEWTVSVENRAPQAKSFSLNMVEDEQKILNLYSRLEFVRESLAHYMVKRKTKFLKDLFSNFF